MAAALALSLVPLCIAFKFGLNDSPLGTSVAHPQPRAHHLMRKALTEPIAGLPEEALKLDHDGLGGDELVHKVAVNAAGLPNKVTQLAQDGFSGNDVVRNVTLSAISLQEDSLELAQDDTISGSGLVSNVTANETGLRGEASKLVEEFTNEASAVQQKEFAKAAAEEEFTKEIAPRKLARRSARQQKESPKATAEDKSVQNVANTADASQTKPISDEELRLIRRSFKEDGFNARLTETEATLSKKACSDAASRRRSGRACSTYTGTNCGYAPSARRRAWGGEAKDTCTSTCGLCPTGS